MIVCLWRHYPNINFFFMGYSFPAKSSLVKERGSLTMLANELALFDKDLWRPSR